MTIRRRTRGGAIELSPFPKLGAQMRCGCGATTELDGGALIGVRSEVAAGPHDGRAAELAICGTCLSTAIALHLGRQHIAAGGDVADLDPDQPA